jgi:Ca2+-transporting ATPase
MGEETVKPTSSYNKITGLTEDEVRFRQRQYGKNIFQPSKQFRILYVVKGILAEPMFILLVLASCLYFMLGDKNEGIMMAVAISIVVAISIYQEVKSSLALRSLQQYTEAHVSVIRNNRESIIMTQELVPGDIMLLAEGMKVPADALIIASNDLSVNESIITGESLPVEKEEAGEKNKLYQGTAIDSGKCTALVTETGKHTVLGKIGKAVSEYQATRTILQVQVNRFVKRFALFGFAAFLAIFTINYFHYGVLATSLLFALTLAMSVIPEEIPVAFSSFMALGAYKMSRLGIISRQPQVIENLGAVTVLCLDKTGTLTENRMQVKAVYDIKKDTLSDVTGNEEHGRDDVLFYGTLASESAPFDAMEKAILEANLLYDENRAMGDFQMVHEYPLEGRPPMMTHIYKKDGNCIAAAKGAVERIINICSIEAADREKIKAQVKNLGSKGYRLLAVSRAIHAEDRFPEKQDDFQWKFVGLLALYDPPKKNITTVLKKIRNAGIGVKILTGDHPETAMNIAAQAEVEDYRQYTIGDEVINMEDEKLQLTVKQCNVFARMFPDAKVKVIKALKENGEIVAMTGDGVNDGPALKLADVGIAMGKKGTETARTAADLVLTDDNLEHIATAVSEGRKIFNNLMKAIRYIVSIHIPIILTASFPLILSWKYPNIFTPVHVIFLELIMGPTCSIFFEREPVEKKLMLLPPRTRTFSLFAWKELLISMVQGLVIAAGVLTLYYIFMQHHTISETRTIVFTTLISANVFLTFTDRSFTNTIFQTVRYKNNLALPVITASCLFLASLHLVPPVQALFQLAPVYPFHFMICVAVAFVSVMWFELYKVVTFGNLKI